jgi:hypothetical protein
MISPCVKYFTLFFFLVVLGFELRASCLLGWCTAAQIMHATLSALVILEIGSGILSWLAWVMILPFALSAIAAIRHEPLHLALCSSKGYSFTFNIYFHGPF